MVQAFSRSPSSRPVVDNSVGIVTQTDLAKMRGSPGHWDTSLSEIMTPGTGIIPLPA